MHLIGRRSVLMGLLGLLCLVPVLGCFPGLTRFPISGEVTLDGDPAGPLSLVFVPVAATGPGCSLISVDGTFQAQAQQGLPLGRYDVTIEEHQPDLEDYENRRSTQKFGLADLRIPDKYRRPGLISVEVKSDQINHFLFELNSH